MQDLLGPNVVIPPEADCHRGARLKQRAYRGPPYQELGRLLHS